jgi:alpha-L-rhamnosidase
MNKPFTVFCFLAIIICTTCSKETPPVEVGSLTCNYFAEPLTVGPAGPEFSWQLTSELRDQSQSAYRILVADNESDLSSSNGNIWDSGKAISSQSILIDYKGPTLKPVQQYYWKVKVWNRDDVESDWSAVASFQTGLFTESDWKGAIWIGLEEMKEMNELVPGVHGKGDYLGKQALQRPVIPLFRKDFLAEKNIKSAILCISGLGHYEATINGNKAGDGSLTPGWTNYDKTVYYNTYDVTAMIRKGDNTIGIIVGNGFYNINRERYRKLVIAYGMPKMISLLKLTFDDGSTDFIVSDAGWKTAPSPIIYSSIYGGEDYDARLEQDGWNRPGFDDSTWKNVIVVKPPLGKLIAETDYPLKVMEIFTPVKVVESKPGTFLYDFGQNASGIVELKVKGKRGHEIRLIPAELITRANLANQSASGSPYYFSYIAKSNQEEIWKPRFSYYGFRYVQVEGAVPDSIQDNTDMPRIIGLKLLHTRNSSPSVGDFVCSYDLFNNTNKLINWGIKSNLQSVLTDCPHREKLGWLEQTYLMGGSVHYNFDLYHLYNKQVNDMIEAQTASGLVPDIAPEYVPFEGGFRDSPEWSSASVILPWLIYKWYGDTSVIRKAWPMMLRYLSYLETKSKDHILSHGLGDWFDLGPKSPGVAQLTPLELTATAIYYYDLKLLAQMAKILHKEQEENGLSIWANKVKTAFNAKFLNNKTKVYSTGSQTAMAMPLCVGLADENIRAKVLENLVDSINANNKALTAGDIGFHFLVEALTKGGKSQLLYEMNARDDVPGYGYQLKKGATALTESWPALENVSNNHLMLGHLMEWFYAGLGGIDQDEYSEAYKDVVINPQMVGNIQSVSTSYLSPYGKIACSWEKQTNTILMNIQIPVNTTARVFFPYGGINDISESALVIDKHPDIQILNKNKGQVVCRIGSGRYSFKIRTKI